MKYSVIVSFLLLAILQIVASELHQKGTCSIYGNVSIHESVDISVEIRN